MLLFATTTWAVDMQISQVLDAPDPAVRSGTITYSISLLNSNADTADNVVLTVPLPATTSFFSTNNPACSHDAMTPGTVTCNLGSITGNGLGGPITTIDVVAQTSAATGLTVDIAVAVATTSPDVNLTNNTGMQTTTINDGADLATTKTDVADPVIAGGNISYIVSVQNLGPNDAGQTTVVDTLPPGITFGSALGTGRTCSAVGQDVTCIRGAGIMNGATAPDITMVGQVTGAINGNITNSVTASSVTGEPDPNNNTTTEDTFIDIGADLAVTKAVTPNPATGSAPATFTLSPRNNGPFDAQTVTVTDTLPAGFTFVGVNGGAGWMCGEAGGIVTCTRPTFTVGTIDDITIDTIAPATGPFTNLVDISSVTPDAIPGNNADSLMAGVVPDGADLSMSKTKMPNPVAQGSPLTSTIVVTNNGPQPTSGVLTVTDVLDPGEIFVMAAGTNWNCNHVAGTVICTYLATPLASGAATTVATITTTAAAAGTLTNNATVIDMGGTPDNVSGNDAMPASSLSTTKIADLQIAKSATMPDANTTLDVTENRITYTLVVTNDGPAAVGRVVVTDTIPGFVTGVVGAVPNTTPVGVSDDSGGKFTCTTGATVTCTSNVGQTLANAEVVTFTITVDRPLDGGVQNNSASVLSTLLGDDDPTNNADTASITVDPIADVELQTKVVTPGTVEAGTNATYVITLRNNGPAAADNVQVSDVFMPPAGRSFSLISVTPSMGACGGLVLNTIDCNIGTLARDEVQTITVVIRPAWDVMNDSWTLPNTATVSTTTTESNAANNAQPATLNVIPAKTDLLVNKIDLVDPLPFDPLALPTNVIVYQVNTTNRGPSVATNVILSDDMTPKAGKQLTFQCDDAGSASCNAGTSLCNNTGTAVTGPATLNLMCNLPNLEANETNQRFLFFLVDSPPDSTGDTHNNLSTVSANENDTVPANDSEGEPTSVRVKVDLGVTKVAGTDPVDINAPFNWNIVVANNGPGDSDMSDLADTLPAGMELTAPPVPAQGTCTGMAGSTAFTCALGTINNGNNVTVTVPVRVTVFPAGGLSSNTTSVSSFGVDTVPGNDMFTGTVTVQKSSIAGTVFADADDNGLQGGGELGIPGVQMTLTGTDAFGNPVNVAVMTDANGDYLFDNLPPSDATGYSITETQPPGFVDGLESIGGVIIPGSRGTNTIPGVVLGSNTALIDHDFADVPNTSISGVVWSDENNDGVRDPTELIRIAGVQITLTGIDDLGAPVNLVTMTAADGSYAFNMLRAGTYTVTETQPTAWADGMESVGSAGGTVGNDVFSGIMLGVNQMAVDYDFGETGSSLSGFVYNDLDGNGINGPMDPGIPGVTITLTGTDADGNPVNRMVVTGPDGSYRFVGLPQPDGIGYTVTETQPPGVTDGIDTIDSAGGTVGPDMFFNITFPGPGTNATNYNFGEGALVAPARISGRVFFDGNHNRTDDENSGQGGWTVELVQRPDPNSYDNVTIIATTTTDANGDYAFEGLSPGDYEVVFRHPDGGAVYDKPESTGTVGNTDFGTIRSITLVAGADVMAQNLPLDPSGVVYDAVTRVPVAGAVVTLSGPPGFNPATQLVGGVGNVNQTTGPTGQYQYLLLVGAPIGDYTLTVTAPTGYLPAPSSLISACPNTLAVAPLPAPALVQDSATAPPLADTLHDPNTCAATTANPAFAAGQGSTQYYFAFNLSAIPGGSADLLNNHILLDPITGDVLTIVKTAGLVNVSRGDLLPFTLTIRNNLQGPVTNINIVDQLPPGFKYRDGSATVDGVAREPVVNGKQLIWAGLNFTGAQQRVIKLIAVVGAGVAEANYSNRAWGVNRLVNLVVTNIAQATVRVVPDPLIDCSDVIGKVYADRNANGYQDADEPGLPNVRIASVRGLLTTTDQHERYHITCVRIPDEERGSNAIFKLDERTLPAGFELTTENPRVIRLTRGKMGKVNFGATEQMSPTDPDDAARAGPADIHFSYDPLEQTPALNVHATPNAAPFGGSVRFVPYSNYQAWIERAELRLFAAGHGASSHPLEVLPVQIGETVSWQVPEAPDYDSVDYVLRVYDAEDHFDETRTKRLHLAHPDFAGRDNDLLAGYGEDSLEITNIPVSGGAVTINGTDMQPGQTITVMGQAVPIDHEGRFAMRQIMPAGPHVIDVRIESADGSTTEFERSVNIAADDWIYVALADLTVGRNYTDGPIEQVTGREADRYDSEAYVDGRLAFYLKGKIKGEYLITAAADTREQPLHHLFDNFSAKDPRSLLRRLYADRHYPIYGDDSTTVEDAPTQGRFYVRIERGESQVLWGDFHVRMNDSELIRQNRGLYGARLRLHTEGQTSFGDKRGQIDAFAAEPGTLPARDEFRGTGGSIYYLRRQGVLEGSEWISIEFRDKDTGLVLETRQLAPCQDYDLNYLQGRVLLTEPLASTISDDRLVRTGSLSGHHAYLVVTYEFTPGLAKVEDFAVGGRAFYWLNDHLRLGLTNYRQDSPGTKQDLYGADMLMRMTDSTYLKFEAARSEGPGSGSQQSIDGGFNFFTRGGMRSKADAYHLEAAVDLGDMGWRDRGTARAYWQDRDDGFSGPGQVTGGRDAARKGVELDLNLTNASALSLNANESKGDGSRRRSLEFDIDQHFANAWSIGLGMRADDNEVSTPSASPTLNRGGSRSDLAVRLGFDPGLEGRFAWNSYVFAQGTVHRSGDRKRNDRIGLGGDMRLNDRFTVSSEVSTGKAGLGASLGGEYQRNDRTSHYLSYALDPDRGDTGFRGRQGRLTSGTRHRFKNHGSVFGEQRLQHGDGPSGLTRAFGLDLSSGDHWTYGLRGEFGRIADPVAGDLKRRAGGASLGYNRDAMNYAADFEYRDESGTLGDRNTWLLRNNFGYQIDPDWRVLARVNLSFSNGAGGNFADGEFAEAIGGFAFRPIDFDRLNMLFRYRFFYDLPSPGQFSDAGGFADFAQRSHILAADVNYELTPRFAIGGKVAWKHGELRDSRTRAEWFDSETLFGVARVDFHVTRKWDAVLEGRVLDIKQADDRRMGALFGLYRHINDNVKFGVGYNFTDFSDDLTDLDYDNDGFFFNLIGKY